MIREAVADTGGCEMKLGTLPQTVGLILAILTCFAAAGMGSLATTPQIPGWYANLAKPTWTPPGWLFGPVWTLLYLMMAVAAWLVWRRAGFTGAKLPLALFAIQLALNSCGPCCSSGSIARTPQPWRSSCCGPLSWRR
jgi:hypothetical protein